MSSPRDRLDSTAAGLGLLAVGLFALTLPATRLAVAGGHGLPPLFVAFARGALAGLLAAGWLLARRAPWPARADWPGLLSTAGGVVLGFPVLVTLAMRSVGAAHGALALALLPLATAAIGAALARKRVAPAFWGWSACGSALVGAEVLRGGGAGGWHGADILLLGAVLAAGWGYAQGARMCARMPAAHVISWAVVLGLPLTLPATLVLWPWQGAPIGAWAALGYLGVVSAWLGFFPWYRALALGGVVRVSQLQLLQPFLSMLAAAAWLGERVDAWTWGFALLVVLSVYGARRVPVSRSCPSPSPVPNPAPRPYA